MFSVATIIDMKQVQCSSISCPNRRVHHERPNVPRGPQLFWVEATHPGPWFCSIECSVYNDIEVEVKDEQAKV